MNRKKILQLILTSTTVVGGMSLANSPVEAIELNNNIINDKESIINFNDSYEGKVVNVDTNLRVRADASKESKVIGYLKDGDICEIKSETVEWYRINFNGNEGYVDKEYVELVNESSKSISVKKGQVVGTEDGLIVRQSASVDSLGLALIRDGDLVEIISKNGEWYNIKTGSTLGFVYEKYINVVEEELNQSNNTTVKGKVNDISSNLRVRLEASDDSAIVGYLLGGQEVEILEEEGDWYKISYNEKVGYVNKEYISKVTDSDLNIPNDSIDKEPDVDFDGVNDSGDKESDSDLGDVSDSEDKEPGADLGDISDSEDKESDVDLGDVSDSEDKELDSDLGDVSDIEDKESDSDLGDINDTEDKESDSDLDDVNGTEDKELDVDLDEGNDVEDKVSDSDLNIPSGDDKDLDSNVDIANDYVDKELNNEIETPDDTIVEEKNDFIINTDEESESISENSRNRAYTREISITGKATVINANEGLRVRLSASLNSTIIGHVYTGNQLDVIGLDGDWYKVEFNNTTGYVHKDYVNFTESESNIIGQGTVINANEGLRIRKSASTSSEILGHVYTGNKLDIIGSSGDWYKIKFGNITGYVHKDYVNFTESESNITGQGVVINANEGLRIRKSASTSSEILGHVYTGNKLDIIGSSGDWYKVKFNNTTGYVHKDYVKLNESGGSGSNNNGSTSEDNIIGKGVVINSDLGLRVRQSASTESAILGYLYTGNEVKIIGASGLWYKIDYNGKEAYVHKDYIKFTEENNSGSNNNNGSTEEVYINAKGKVVDANEGLRVRSSASLNASVLGYVYTGNILEIVATNGNWYKVKFRDTTGYVSKDYVEIMNATNPNPPGNNESENIKQIGEVYNTGSNLRVRASASINSAVLGYLTDGTKVNIIGSDGDWYKIDYKDKVGYVSKEYIKLINDTENPGTPPTENPNPSKPGEGGSNENYTNVISMGSVATSSLNVRSGSGTEFEIIGSLSLNTIVEIVETSSNGWYKVKYNNGFGYVSSDYIKISTNLSNYSMSLDKYVDMQYPRLNMTDNGGEWRNATKEEIKYNLDSNNFIENTGKYMFMKLNYIDGFSLDLVNEVIEGRGILSGKGQAFLDGARKHNVNVMYLLTHARLETGNGTSTLARGVLVTEVDGRPVEPRVVYNMYGVGAVDSDPLRGGAEYAYKQGWFTPELAISEGASWISRNYINNAEYGQNTLYKMRWNISSSGLGWHQYATDIAWAEKQARLMAPYLERCGVALEFDIPTFGKGK